MCGRFIISKKIEEINERWHVDVDREKYKVIYNAAPGQNLPVITQNQPDKLQFFKWGLVPFWAKDPKIGNRLINARAETILEKPSFKYAVQKRRCLIPADGFYEWKKTKQGKQPYRIYLKDESLFAFAGIWERWQSENEELYTFSIITTHANDFMKPLHNRMPVILTPETEAYWMDENLDIKEIKHLCQPLDDELLSAHPVSQRVNNPANNDHDLLKPVPELN